MKRTLVALSLAVFTAMAACDTKPKPTVPPAPRSEEDSITALFKKPGDSVPPTARWCTEMFPSQAADSFTIEKMQAGVLTAYKWKWQLGQPKRITVRFNDGIPAIQDRIKTIAAKWEPFVGAKFVYVPSSQEADIKISFQQRGASWSRIGTDSKGHSPSMNFGWLEEETVDSLFEQVVLHEFGHAIGLVHEHQLPNGNPIKWNVDSVYAYYLNYPNYWTVQCVKDNIFFRYQRNQLNAGMFDPTSIMMYEIPARFTTNGYSTPINVRLSPEDKRLVSDVYRR
ncbi:M12 family metallopeptidase [Chitinophaga filiformis]|uniref:M12 family metallopeptidase n=1 Tax=Chitinophaga filiformis TaxID=104663 RepID=A0ABY4I810_CHIFI|nr:M12 family metallopeptidase [Chitinophaga filiformis]UPK71384.1 M12 family metallopeptidase [Chitinophaga filiformis]